MKKKFTTKKSLGQNFLVNPSALSGIVEAGELSPEDTVVEIGPGTGNLTEKIIEKTKNIIVIEKDARLIEFLQKKFPTIKVIEGDVLKINPQDLGLNENGYKIVANIPYYITSRFIRQILDQTAGGWPKPKLIILTIQKEVAQRIVAVPPKMNLLGVSVQYYAEPKIIRHLAPGNFRPAPDVDSSVIKLVPRPAILDQDRESRFFTVVKAGFSGKRKKLANNLSSVLKIPKEVVAEKLQNLGVSKDARAQELALTDWLKIYNKL